MIFPSLIYVSDIFEAISTLRFSISAWTTSTHTWKKWKRRWGDAVMPHLITILKSANNLCDTEGLFQGWQNDQFRLWDSTAIQAPDRKTHFRADTPMLTFSHQQRNGL